MRRPAYDPNLEKQTLWIVSELYFPEVTSTGYYITSIAEGLAQQLKVKVICGQPNYSARGILAAKHEFHNDVEIFRVAGTRLDKNVLPFRLLNMLTFGISVLLNSVFRFRKGDKVLVVTTPPNLPFITAFSALLRGSGYYLLVHDNYPEALIAVGKASRDSFIVKIIEFSNRWLYKHAAKIIVVGRDMLKLVQQKTQGLDVAIRMIPNWAELESVSPVPRDSIALIEDLGLRDKIVFLYAGNLGHPNDIETIVETASGLPGDSRVHFLFLGAGVKRPWLEKEIKKRSLTNITLLEPRPRSEQIEFLNACDVGFVSLVKGMWGVSMPSRTYNLLAAGKPILAITESGSELDQVVVENEIGWTVEPHDPDRLAETIHEIEANLDTLGPMSIRARNAALSQYNFEAALGKYLDAIG